ncbi:MAG: UPF0175 family protein [Candidatus Hodarchaeales archaeon]
MKTSSFRLDESQDNEIEIFARKLQIDKSAAVRKLIDAGIKEYRKREALDKVREQKWTVWKAALSCGESYRSFLQLLRERNIRII